MKKGKVSKRVLKPLHETAVIKDFLALYNQQNGSNLSLMRLGDPQKREPDGVCSDRLFIELVNAYDSEGSAKRQWDAAQGREAPHIPGHIPQQLDPEAALVRAICKKMNKLNSGNYEGAILGRIILLCNYQSPLFDNSDVASIQQTYIPFRDGSWERHYEEIWLIWKPSLSGNRQTIRLE